MPVLDHSPHHLDTMALWLKTHPTVPLILPKLHDLERKIQGMVKSSEEKQEAIFSMVQPYMNEEQISYAKLPWISGGKSRPMVHFDDITTAFLDAYYSSKSIDIYVTNGVEYALYLINKEPYELQKKDDEDENSDTYYVSLLEWEQNLSNAAAIMVESTMDHIRDIGEENAPDIITKLEMLIEDDLPECQQQAYLTFANQLGQAMGDYFDWVEESLEEISAELSEIAAELGTPIPQDLAIDSANWDILKAAAQDAPDTFDTMIQLCQQLKRGDQDTVRHLRQRYKLE